MIDVTRTRSPPVGLVQGSDHFPLTVGALRGAVFPLTPHRLPLPQVFQQPVPSYVAKQKVHLDGAMDLSDDYEERKLPAFMETLDYLSDTWKPVWRRVPDESEDPLVLYFHGMMNQKNNYWAIGPAGSNFYKEDFSPDRFERGIAPIG